MLWLTPNKTRIREKHAADEALSPPTRRQRAVLLVNTGTPDGPDAASVRRYLAEFLSDPFVIQLPTGMGWFQGLLGRFMARMRAARSAELYQRIWTERGSPLRVIMEDQAVALEAALPEGWRVFVGMRYGQPGIAEALEQVVAAGVAELVVVPMYPQFSRTTTGTVVQELFRGLRETGPHINFATRTTWYDDVGYIHAQARLISEFAAQRDLQPEDTHLLFSAHGLPVSYIRRGDPYGQHVRRTVHLLAQKLRWPAERMSVAYQSRMGPAEWLKPDVGQRLAELSEAGERKVLVYPISFTVDCLETLEEIGIRERAAFEAGGGEFHMCPALNTYEPFIAALKNLVLRGAKPMAPEQVKTAARPATDPKGEPPDGGLESLVMIGVSLRNQVGAGLGPKLRYSEPSQFSSVKRTQDSVYEFLTTIRAEGVAREGFIWNTCHRFEFYGWLDNPHDAVGRDCTVGHVRQRLFENEPEGLGVNVLFGAEAWHHLMRTVAGLNSGLPGDTDIVEQLQTASRIAERAGLAGPHCKQVVKEAVALANDARQETAWGRLAPGYCYAALARILGARGRAHDDDRHLVIGGSTTSRSVLQTLFTRFDVRERQATLAYRNHHGGQIKLLRKAIGNGKRLKVGSYSEPAVLAAIAESDVVFLGIDRDEPVLHAADLHGLRDFAERPLTIIDFNTLGSTRDVENVAGVTLWTAEQLEGEVAAYAAEMCAQGQFAHNVEEAETWIARRSPRSIRLRLKLPCMASRNGEYPRCTGCRVGNGNGKALAGSDNREDRAAGRAAG